MNARLHIGVQNNNKPHAIYYLIYTAAGDFPSGTPCDFDQGSPLVQKQVGYVLSSTRATLFYFYASNLLNLIVIVAS